MGRHIPDVKIPIVNQPFRDLTEIAEYAFYLA